MFITSFSIENFRSITTTKSLPLRNLSILIGQNNEGKSNFLHALVITLEHLQDRDSYFSQKVLAKRRQMGRMSRQRYFSSDHYDFERDFPKHIPINGGSETKFSLSIEMNKKEKKQFKEFTKLTLKGELELEVNFGERHHGIHAKDSSKIGNVNFAKKYDEIASYIGNNFHISYIPAVRDSDSTMNIINKMVSNELLALRRDPEYEELLKKIQEKQKPYLDNISNNITETVHAFLPLVKKISIESVERLERISSGIDVYVDDGTDTSLELKGDGIKSLIAISVLHYTAKQKGKQKNIILALEEPESHLHPRAIHQLVNVLNEISKENQVIITTHSPLLVDRLNVSNNLIVHQSEIKPANKISEIRDILGVNIEDNLNNARFIILCEGDDDVSFIKKLMAELSSKLNKAIKDGSIAFDSLNGSTNASHRISYWKSSLCNVFTIFDDDNAGHLSFEKAREKQLLDTKNTIFLKIKGMDESEMEDLILPKIYKKKIFTKLGIDLDKQTFRNSKKKWSERLSDCCDAQGKPWDDSTKRDAKNIVSQESLKLGSRAIHSKDKTLIKNMIKNLEREFEGLEV